MTNASATIAGDLSRYYQERADTIVELVQPLSLNQIWKRPYPYGNSIGHLLLHLTGNLSYYVGAQIAGTGYVRNRPLEFADESRRPKEDVLRAFEEAVAMVQGALAAQTAADWARPYEAVGSGQKDRLS